jgi:hypothetical protein
MTMNEAATIRKQWYQGESHLLSDHLNPEFGDTTGNYVCIFRGESVAHRQMEQVGVGTLLPIQVGHQYVRTTSLDWNALKMVDRRTPIGASNAVNPTLRTSRNLLP